MNFRLFVSSGAVGAIAVAALASPSSAWATAAAPPSWQQVIVTGAGGQAGALRADVRRIGGRVDTSLPVIDGFTARVPAAQVARLRQLPGVRSVTPDARGHLMGLDPALGYDVAGDQGSLYSVAQVTHAKDAWAHNITGRGVDVALIDSGVARLPGLTSGNIVDGPDLSFDSQDPELTHRDTFGHGTHMASIISGRDVAASGATYARADSHRFTGIAPDARVISVKVAASDGGTDVSQVIAAIDWVAQHAHAPGYNIRVLNLSYGTDSVQDPTVDPLDFAVENAWRAGITVVVSSGNDGTNRTALADPASDPLVLAVGADDTRGTDGVKDDVVPAFAQRGTASRQVDLIAPGVHILGLRDPNSSADLANPGARVGDRFFRGSGTSQAAAVVSGLAALYLSAKPTATPDQVKRALTMTASAPAYVKRLYAGLGVPDVNKAIGALIPALSVQAPTGATGTGSLEAARGTIHADNGTEALTGEQDIFGSPWDAATWAAASRAGTSWTDGIWSGSDWTGAGLSDSAWSGSGFASHGWSGTDWSSHGWSSHGWSSHGWSDVGWDSHGWSDSAWHSHGWSASTWSSHGWSNNSWD